MGSGNGAMSFEYLDQRIDTVSRKVDLLERDTTNNAADVRDAKRMVLDGISHDGEGRGQLRDLILAVNQAVVSLEAKLAVALDEGIAAKDFGDRLARVETKLGRVLTLLSKSKAKPKRAKGARRK
jgi:hypothetical protein